MKLTGNTILITGGGSGIGRAIAEEFHKRGNKVIIAGRRKKHLHAVVDANPGIEAVELDIQNAASIAAIAKDVTARFPKLNVLFNNAGIMIPDDVSTEIDDAQAVSIVTTNLLGPIRLTAALIEHFKKQDQAVILNNSSILGFVPLSFTAVYSATKAAIHSYSLSLRHKLAHTSVRVQEIAPPWVRTELMGSQDAEAAMPLGDFIAETFQALEKDTPEVLVDRAKAFRNNVGPGEYALVNQFNDQMAGLAASLAS